jgi:hypothetical protein
MSKERILRLAAPLALILALAACGDSGEPSQQDVQTALSASNELPPGDPTIQVEKMRCEAAPDDKQAWLCEYRFPPADPIKGIFKKSAGAWRHVGPAPEKP